MPALLKKYQDRENGFTLVELLIVVLIIGVLAAIAIPVYLGIQQQGYKASVRADVNLSVKRVQVALTEGKTAADVKTNQAAYTQKSVKGEVTEIRDSSTAGASADDFSLSGIVTTSSSPAGPVNYGYFYDSVTGKFTESDDAVALGSSTPSIVITTASLPNATVGSAYTATVATTVVKANGTTRYAATGLPTGWTIDPNTGVVSAPASAVTTPTTLSIAVTATNGAVTANKTYTVNVYAKPIISTASLTAGLTNTAYTGSITATGNPTPTFAVTGGSLPTGVNLGTDGTFNGTPTVAGSYNFTVTASNSGGTDVKGYTLVINASATITTLTLPDATVGTAYNQTVQTTGYPAPTVAVTNLPSGLSFDNTTNKISGTPNPSAGATTPTVTITATNSVNTATRSLPITVNAIAPSITTAALTDSAVGTGYSQTLAVNNASGAVTWAVSGTMPAGLNLNTTTGVISGTGVYGNNGNNFGTFPLTFTATAAGKTSAPVALTLRQTMQWNITNASAEDTSNPTGTWGNYYGPNSSFSTDTAHTGSRSYKIVTNGGTPQGIIAWPTGLNLAPYTHVKVTAWVSGNNGAQWYVGGRNDPYEEGYVSQNITTTGAGNWQQLTIEFNPRGKYPNQDQNLNAVGIQVVQNSSPPPAGQVLYMDDITFTVG